MVALTHRRFNDMFTFLVLVGAVYVLATPFIPKLTWILKRKHNIAPYSGNLAKQLGPNDSPQSAPPKDNRIVIPSADVNLAITEGMDVSVVDTGGSLKKNLWVSSPSEVGNTIIIAHRFSYQNPTGGFYYLDKVQIGDKLAVYWQGVELVYRVDQIKVVPNTAIDIEYNTPDRTLTLYTCTPIFSSDKRLVVIAKPYIAGVDK